MRAMLVGLCVPLLLVPGCASHLVRGADFDPVGAGGQPYARQQTSFFGRSGASTDATGYNTREECRGGDLAQVEVRRNVGQTIVTVLTLGMVSPATIYFLCAKPETPTPDRKPGDPF